MSEASRSAMVSILTVYSVTLLFSTLQHLLHGYACLVTSTQIRVEKLENANLCGVECAVNRSGTYNAAVDRFVRSQKRDG